MCENGNVKVSMMPYPNKVLRDFPEKLGDIDTSPAADHLFKVRPGNEARLLPEEQAVSFNLLCSATTIYELRRDIQTAIAFQMTRVRATNEENSNT